MNSASTSAVRSLRSRSIPFATASALSLTLFIAHTLYSQPLLNDELKIPLLPGGDKKPRASLPSATSPYTPIAWGTNRYLTLSPDRTSTTWKKPGPMNGIGATPLRHLVLAEKYGACVDARGDCWMWGAGYDPSGEIGRSLKGKKLASLASGPAKLFALSQNGRIYVVSASKAFQDHRLDKQERAWWSRLFGSNPGVDFIELKAEGGLKRGERWHSVSAGLHHLLAVTNKGRTFSLPLSPAGNSHRQLGTRRVFDIPYPVPSSSASAIPLSPDLPPEVDIRFERTLTEIPSLRGLEVAQVITSDRTSFVRTPNGRVLGFGSNESGQIGLGANATIDIVSVPMEIQLARSYAGNTSVRCLDVTAGGSTTFFTVEKRQPDRGVLIDLLACGNGMTGTLGNGLWSSASGGPVRVKTISGLEEYSEKDRKFLPLGIHSISVSSSPSSHVFAVLDTASEADVAGVTNGLYGKDVMVWGGNVDYQLGNGKRSSLAVPQHLPPVVPRPIDPSHSSSKGESAMSSGSRSPMPHSRLQLHQTRANAYDLNGKLIKKNVRCEEVVVAGYNASVLYNKILD